jgi:hypothetical protein
MRYMLGQKIALKNNFKKLQMGTKGCTWEMMRE